jgi:predicted metalloprotease with PDZ domain
MGHSFCEVPLMIQFRLLIFFSLPFSLLANVAQSQTKPIVIMADLTDAPRKLFHAEIDLPVHAGPLALITPEWIPGAHGPRGPVANIVGVVFSADGKTLPWHRDDVDVYEYHLEVPPGVTSLHAHLDCINTRSSRAYAVLEWESLMLYPAHTPVRQIAIQPSAKVPAGWGIGTSLRPLSAYDPAHPAGGSVHYATTTVELLEDSPIMTGANFHEYALAPEITPKHFVDFIGADPADVSVRPEEIAQLSRLIREGLAMYGPPHYTSYHFLVLIPSHGGGGGLEHHESSDNSVPQHSLEQDDFAMTVADILPHEFTHSWNGKYRRPAGLATPDYATPMRNQLLWIYEGLTDYMGQVMSARIGSTTPQQFRECLALTAARMDATSGRAWRNIEDTTYIAAMPHPANVEAWSNWRRGVDYYYEGDLVWLDVDTTIRRLTSNQKSLHDFLLIFLQKGGSGVPQVLPYELDEITADLNQVAPRDWAAFFNDRVSRVNSHANVEGIEQGGYRLVYTDTPTAYEKGYLKHRSATPEFWFTVGLALDPDGTVTDVRVGGPADKAKVNPGQKVTVVDGKAFTRDALHAAIATNKGSTQPLTLMVQDENDVFPVTLDYHGGEQYPTLLRMEGVPDYLADITRPLTSADTSQAK